MADEMTWREAGGILLLLVGGMFKWVYSSLAGQIKSHATEIFNQREELKKVDTRLALLEQRSEDQHKQVIEAVFRVGAEVRDWRADALKWREHLSIEMEKINEKFTKYDQNIATFYRENIYLRKPEDS